MTVRGQLPHYYSSARRSVGRYGIHPLRLATRLDNRPVFIVGSPRSGTTFTAACVGRVQGFADLGELRPLKRMIGELAAQPQGAAARRIRRIVRIAQRVGLTAGLRAIEQTPESTYLIPAIREAFPDVRFLHLVRDGRDVAASLIKQGWLGSAAGARRDEVGNRFGSSARFWVENERAAEFEAASEATRAAWVWRRYESTARRHLTLPPADSLEIRYERLVGEPSVVAREIAVFLGADEVTSSFVGAFQRTRGSSQGRWHHDLDSAQLADVERECGGLLAELGYA